MSKKHVYREGDLVRVVQPFVYQRCGYPYDIVKEGQRLGDTFAEDIVALIDKMDPREDLTPVRPPVKTARGMQLEALFVENSPFVPQGFAGMGSDYHDLCSRFARIIAQRRGFGGNERRIYTEDRVDLHGAVLRVSSKFVRKTGFLRTERISGRLDAQRRVAAGPITLRVYVAMPGLPTKAVVVEGQIEGGRSYQLLVRVDPDGRATAELH